MLKASPASSLVMSETESLLEFLVVTLDPPAQLGEIDELDEWNVLRQRGEPVFCRLFLVFRPFDQQPLCGSALLEPFVAMRGAHAQPRIARCEPISRALAPRDRLPGCFGQSESKRLDLDRLVFRITPGPAGRSATPRPGFRRQRPLAPRPDGRVRLEARDVGKPECRDLGAQLRITAVSGIPQHDAMRNAARARGADLVERDLGLGREADRLGYPGLVTSQGISGPFLRQVEPGCD